MPRLISFAPAIVLLCIGRGAVGAEVTHFEPLAHLTRTAALNASRVAGTAAPFTLAFNALGRDFTLELEPNARLADVARALHLKPGVAAYRGTIAGNPGSWVRIVMDGAAPMGLVWDGQTLYALEAGFDSAAATSTPVIFRFDDLYIPPGTMSCGGTDIVTAADALAAITADAATIQALPAQGATLNLNLGAVADYEFSQSFGANAQTALLARVNNVDGIFSSQLGVQISVPANAIEIFTTSDDPFTSTDPAALLDELAQYRGASTVQDAQGLTHLFTGRDLDGTTVGIAYIGSVCMQRSRFDSLGRSFAVGLSEGSHGLTIDSLIAAHEIGHNFGAPHDAEAGSPCESTPPTFLMNPSINGSSTFSDCSKTQMQPVIDSASCLTPIGPPDVALSIVTPGAVEPATVPFDYSIDARNLGIDPATSVSVTITLDPAFVVDAATVPNGSCTIATQSVVCDLGDLAGSTARILTLTLHAGTAGNFSIGTVATADQDTNSANNATNDTVTIEPSIDLGLSGSAPALKLDESATIALTVANTADFDATNVAVDINIGSGLAIDSASLGGAGCTVGAGTVACNLASLGAHQSAELLIAVTASATGNQPLDASVSGDQSEIDTGNNSLSLTIGVAAATAQSTSSGGGSAGELAVLLMLAWLRKLSIRTRIRRPS